MCGNYQNIVGKSLIPELWKKGLTVLAYKKGPTDGPANFRPITLEPVIAKVLTSFMRFCARTNILKRIFRKDFGQESRVLLSIQN